MSFVLSILLFTRGLYIPWEAFFNTRLFFLVFFYSFEWEFVGLTMGAIAPSVLTSFFCSFLTTMISCVTGWAPPQEQLYLVTI